MNPLIFKKPDLSGFFSSHKFIYRLFIMASCCFWFSCKTDKAGMEFVDEIASLSPDSVNTTDASSEYTQDDQGNIQRLIRLTLNDLFKEDLQKGFLDSASRKYLYDQADLNEDGNSEIIVGLTGPYFCGSGGCTMLVLSNHGDVITRFSVVKYPIFIDEETTNGWKNLILFSGSENRLVTYDGQTYPSNPSTLEIYSGSFEGLDKLLDWEKNEVLGF